MRIFITGGTGFVGKTLSQRLTEQGHEVTILTRSKAHRPQAQGITYVEGDPTRPGPWQEQAARHQVIINLAGASIFSRWTKKTKQAIHDSRVLTTKNLVEAMSNSRDKATRLFLSTSAVGYYGFCGDDERVEESAPGKDWLATVVQDWEAAAWEARTFGVRVVLCRFGIVLGKDGGALKRMLPPFRYWLGSPLGKGNQWFSWIHEQDLINVYLFLIEQKGIEGPINCTAPQPVRNRDLTEIMGEVFHKPTFMPGVPGFMIRLLMGEFGTVILKGQRVFPRRLLDMGFTFQFPLVREALVNLLRS